MISRLVLSLRKAADEGPILSLNQGHFAINRWDGTGYELTDVRFSSMRAMRSEDTIT